MPYLKPSRARQMYVCAECASTISKDDLYFRDEPHPRARYFRNAEVRHLCRYCVLDDPTLNDHLVDPSDEAQLILDLDLQAGNLLRIPPRVELVDITEDMVRLLAEDPEQIRRLSPGAFENLICNRLETVGCEVHRVGPSPFRKDGGIDVVAVPRQTFVPFLIAVQMKHISGNRRIGPQPIRDLTGAVDLHGLNMGMLVTNTTFTPDARWIAEKAPFLTRLCDIQDLREWLKKDTLRLSGWRRIPDQIELCPGVSVKLH